MANVTRREAVLDLLRAHPNEWVDGTRIASAEVGGSEGLKRLRELRQSGWDIRMRKHPGGRDIFQYRLIVGDPENTPRGSVAAPPSPTNIPIGVTPGMVGRNFPLGRDENGNVVVKTQVCVDCGGEYAIEADHRAAARHVRWLDENNKLISTPSSKDETDGQTTVPIPPQPPALAFTEKPVVAFGGAIMCPRCNGVRRKARHVKGRFVPADDMCMDPHDHSSLCKRCNGWGVVPNG